MAIFNRAGTIERLLYQLDIPRYPYFHSVKAGVGPYRPEVFDRNFAERQLNEAEAIVRINELSDEKLYEIAETSGAIERFAIDCSLFDPLPWYAGGIGVVSHTADFEYWAKMDFWTLEETACLSIGFKPEKMRDQYKDYASPYSPLDFYWDRKNLIRRAPFYEIANPEKIKPTVFMAWAVDKKLEMPSELVDAVNQQAPSKRPAMLGSVDTRQYESALKTILGLLAQEYGYRGGPVSTDIKRDINSGLGELGLNVDRKTLIKVLNEVAKSLPELRQVQHKRDG